MAAVTEPVIHGSGRTELEWSQSSALPALPETSVSELLKSAARLVIVSPHPDDEVLGCGGLIASLAIQPSVSIPVVILSASDGEAAYAEDQAWPPAKLAPVRRQELASAMKALGAGSAQIIHLDLGDGELIARRQLLQDELTRHIRASDLVLVTYAEDGHPDHEACAQAASAAAQLRGARLLQYPIWAWHWSDPTDAPFLMDALRLPLGKEAMEIKRRAIHEFRTQTGQSVPAPNQPILPPWALARFLRPFEVFIP